MINIEYFERKYLERLDEYMDNEYYETCLENFTRFDTLLSDYTDYVLSILQLIDHPVGRILKDYFKHYFVQVNKEEFDNLIFGFYLFREQIGR